MPSFSTTYELKDDLGKGAFSVVKKCTHRATGIDYAVKIINKRRMTARDLQKLEKEERVCRKLKHPNIVQLHESIAEDLSHYLVFDLVTGGELFDEIVAREYYSENDASTCMQQVLEGISYCHRQNVLHRDLKPENLLLASKAKDAHVKIADFGLAVELDGDLPAWHGFAGTPGYLSPEVLRREPYSKPVDMWACGVIMYILLVGYPPFWDEDQKRLYAQIKSARYDFPSPEWDTVTETSRDLIRQMINPDIRARITAEEALRNPWISQRQRVASTIHRQDTIAGLKRFNARRKLKGAILTTMIATRSKTNLFRNRVSESDLQTPVEEPSPPLTQCEDTKKPLECKLALKPDTSAISAEVLAATQQLLSALRLRDFDTYKQMCASSMVTFCPETGSQMITGLDFHQFALSNIPPNSAENVTLVNPQIRVLSDTAACVCYVRLNQIINKSGHSHTEEFKETRVWSKIDGQWRCMHVHTS